MMTNSLRTALCALLMGLTLCATCFAQTSAPPSVSLLDRLKTLYPATHFGTVTATPWPGVFEVAMGSNLAYVDESGQFFLFGHLFDMKALRDLTTERKDTLTRIDFAALPLADAIREVRGTGARAFAIFSDPDCPYCRRLEAEMKNISDVTIYTFLMPIESLHPDARAKAIAVWCAENRVSAWHALMWRDEVASSRECIHPIDHNVELGERLGITGTPTLIAADGRVLPGAASGAQIDAWLGRTTAGAVGPAAAKGTQQ
jgi:thiol:disulfide interchange protein DsbC